MIFPFLSQNIANEHAKIKPFNITGKDNVDLKILEISFSIISGLCRGLGARLQVGLPMVCKAFRSGAASI
jgi:hypothetical protein